MYQPGFFGYWNEDIGHDVATFRVMPAQQNFGADGAAVHPEGDVDLELWKKGRKSVVVCRHWQVRQVGIELIRDLNGILKFERADEAIFLSSGSYTHDAWQFAQGKPLRLIDGEGLLNLILTLLYWEKLNVIRDLRILKSLEN